jgi:hypothetical protein
MGIKVNFIFIYQIGINNCQIALRIMGMNLGRFKRCVLKN